MGENQKDVFTALIIVFIAIAAFGLGRLSAIYDAREPIVVRGSGLEMARANDINKIEFGLTAQVGEYLASKNGTRYYPLGCVAGDRIAEQNRIWFATVQEAEAAGLTLSASCK